MLRLRLSLLLLVVPVAASISFTHQPLSVSQEWTGTAFFDCNNDGLVDVMVASTLEYGVPGKILVNQGFAEGEVQFTVVDTPLSIFRGLGWGDMDNDGLVDIVVRSSGIPEIESARDPSVMFNNGAENCSAWTVVRSLGSRNVEAVMMYDIDGDGWLDVWAPGYSDYRWARYMGERMFQAKTILPGSDFFNMTTVNGEGSTIADFTGDGKPDILYDYMSGKMVGWTSPSYPNYELIPPESLEAQYGIPLAIGAHEDMNWVWGDCDNDGHLDFFLSGKPFGLYVQTEGVFSEVSASRGIVINSDLIGTKGADWGDYNNDGYLDLLVSDDGTLKLFQNDGNCQFQDVSHTVGINPVMPIRSPSFFDVDNDGDLDIFSYGGLLINNFEEPEQSHFFRVKPVGRGGAGNSPLTPIGAQVDLFNSSGSLIGHREVLAGYNSLQPYWIQHFGGIIPTQLYTVKVLFPTSQRTIEFQNCRPDAFNLTIGPTFLAQTLQIEEPPLVSQVIQCNCRGTLDDNPCQSTEEVPSSSGDGSGTSEAQSSLPLESSSFDGGAFVAISIVIGIIAVCVVVGVVIVFIALQKRKRKQNAADQEIITELQERGEPYASFEVGHTLYNQLPQPDGSTQALPIVTTSPRATTVDDDEKFQIPTHELRFGDEVGRGSFGVVYKGFWRGSAVAIKVMSVGLTDDMLTEFYSEINLMKNLRPHSHVVQFLGYSIEQSSLHLVIEFCEGGSLIHYLLGPAEITHKQSLQFLQGIAAGICHLHREHIIHRDLAARNILLTGSGVAKVGDFGMSRLLENEENNPGQTVSTVGPLKWMAPESLFYRTYSEKSDVWSFGVVIFEIVNRSDPYPKMSGVQVSAGVASQKLRLSELPQEPQLYDLMMMCTEYEQNDRPSFQDICDILEAMH